MKTIMLRELRRLRTPILVMLGIVGLYALAALLLTGSLSPVVRIGGAVAWLVALPLLALALGPRLMAPSEHRCSRSSLAKTIVGAGLLAGLYALLIGALGWADPLLAQLHGDLALLLPGVLPPIVTHFALSVLLLCAAMAISSATRRRIVAAVVAPIAVAAVLGLFAAAIEWVFGPLWGPLIGVHWRTAHLALDQLTVLAFVLGAIFPVAFAMADRAAPMRTGFLWLVGLSIASMTPLALAGRLVGSPAERSPGLPLTATLDAADGAVLLASYRQLPFHEQAASLATMRDDGSGFRVVARGPINLLPTSGPGTVFAWGGPPVRTTGLGADRWPPHHGPLWFCAPDGRTRRLPIGATEARARAVSPSGDLLSIRPYVMRLGERIEVLDVRVGRPTRFSNDGKRIFWSLTWREPAVTDLETGRYWTIPPPPEALNARWCVSPDGRWIAWTATSGVYPNVEVRATIIAEIGGDRRAEFPRRKARGTYWSPDGRYVLLSDEEASVLDVVELPSLQVVRTIHAPEVSPELSMFGPLDDYYLPHGLPELWSPGGRWFLCKGGKLLSIYEEVMPGGEVRRTPRYERSAWAVPIEGGEPIRLPITPGRTIWSRDDRFLVEQERGLVAVELPSGRTSTIVESRVPELTDFSRRWAGLLRR